jgi:predicted transcriptional regulator
MKLRELADKLYLHTLSYDKGLDKAVSGGYVSDLLSDVLANCSEGNVWITLQKHTNIVAVASLKNLAGIIIVGGRELEGDVLKQAEAKEVTIMTTPMSAYETAGMIYQLLNEGKETEESC